MGRISANYKKSLPSFKEWLRLNLNVQKEIPCICSSFSFGTCINPFTDNWRSFQRRPGFASMLLFSFCFLLPRKGHGSSHGQTEQGDQRPCQFHLLKPS